MKDLEQDLVDAGAIPSMCVPDTASDVVPTCDPAEWVDLSHLYNGQPMWQHRHDRYAFTNDPDFRSYWWLGRLQDGSRPTYPTGPAPFRTENPDEPDSPGGST